MAAIEYIRVDNIHEHPDNPRKDIGDVSELAESIKANGILQNLTVVRGHFMTKDEYVKIARQEGVTKAVAEGMYDRRNAFVPDGYTVIIGHRRLAAAKLAGLETVPCVIAEMSDEAQLATMLTENMQRTDLTVYEQAKSFQQLSIDFGMSPADIAAMSGFSEGTVRKRTKLAELDEKKFKKACERGATLFDFAELDKVKDPEARDKCLDAIGTPNFKNVLSSALDQQKWAEQREKWLEQISAFATEIEKRDYIAEQFVRMDYVCNYGRWTGKKDVEVPEDADTVRYFYRVGEYQIDLFREHTENAAEDEERRRKKELDDAQSAKYEELREISARHYALRFEFVKNFGSAKKDFSKILRNACDALFDGFLNHKYGAICDSEELAALLGMDDEDEDKVKAAFKELRSKRPEHALFLLVYSIMDGEHRNYYEHKWEYEIQMWKNYWRDNLKLDEVYYFLEELGYQTSDEERQMRRGTHPLFDVKEEE